MTKKGGTEYIMTNREAIEYIERECRTCKGFYAPKMSVLQPQKIALNQSDLLFLPYKNERNEKKDVSVAVTKIALS